ncbi:major facilitator superfamily domain-containing protein [Podospora didyma]|uniref:Major facilitator superfamily domain-containing protein n=1 Tax=Podospora didyma TaxID=330526 RepID=A0AAE0K1D7_9PEZI|nr:major facilitator superfamily domain-containing protein [Podospora didyma]
MAGETTAATAAAAAKAKDDTISGDEPALQRRRSIERQAVDEGHDADIPSAEGFILSDEDEKRRLEHIADQRQKSLTRRRSQQSESRDIEKDAGTAAGKDGNGGAATSSEEEPATDPNVIDWDENDPENPFNWPSWKKGVNITLISALTFVAPLASSIFAPAVPQLMREFRSDNLELASFVVSVYVLGFAAGPLLIAPLSEIYGRVIVYNLCNIGFVAFLVGCALAPSLNALIVFRFLSGVFGSCPLSNGGGTIADMIVQEKRAAAMGAFSFGPLLGPIIGPIAGGFLANAKGWRWVFWLMVIVAGVLAIAIFVFARESYAPVLLQRKVDRLRKETGNDLLRSKLDSGLSPTDYFKRSIVRPMRMLVFSPLCLVFALYISVIYGYLYIMFTSMSVVFIQQYGFTTGTVGLVFLGLGIGSMSGLVYFGITSDRAIKKATLEEGGAKPEHRLTTLPLGAILLPVGFFIYGWTVQYHVHWIVPILSHAVIGFGNILIFISMNLALVDTFTIYAASALAANTVVRSVFGAVLPLFGLQMYEALGLGWGNSLLAFIAVAMVPIAFLIIKYGEVLRTKYPIKNL